MTQPEEMDKLTEFEAMLSAAQALGEELIGSLGYTALEQGREENLERIISASKSTLGRLVSLAETVQAEAIEDAEDDYYEELIGLMARWMARNPGFTMAELRDHLLLNEAVEEDEVAGNKLRTLYFDVQDDVADYYAERGEKIVWLDSKAMDPQSKGPIRYTLAFLKKPTEKPQPEPVSPVEPTRAPKQGVERPVETHAAEPRFVVTEEVITRTVELLTDMGGQSKAKQLEDQLVEAFGLTEADIKEVLATAVANGVLYRRGIAGRPGFSTGTPLKKNTETEEVSSMDDEAKLAFVEKYSRVAEYVMGSLIALKDISMGLAYDKLWKRAGFEDVMTFEEFKSHVKRMQDDELVTIHTDAKLSTRTGRSKVIRGSKVFIAGTQVRVDWKTNKNDMLDRARTNALNRIL